MRVPFNTTTQVFDLSPISKARVMHVLTCMVDHKGDIQTSKGEVLKTTDEAKNTSRWLRLWRRRK